MALILDIGWTFLLLILIVTACTVFTNAIEWVGKRFNLSEGAVGSVLAAVGTALPETIVPIIAILSGVLGLSNLTEEAGHEIGMGAILGAPFLLSTLAMFVSGFAAILFTKQGKRSIGLRLDKHLFLRDLNYFFVAYAAVLTAGLINIGWLKIAIGISLLGLYGFYVYRTLTKEHVSDIEAHHAFDPLYFHPKAENPSTFLMLLQVLVGLGGIMLLAHLFVDEVHHLASVFNINPMVLSLLIVPIATELPEKFNSVVWLGKGKDNLALGNITGAMVFQSTIPATVGILFTPWILSGQGLLNVILTLGSCAVIYLLAFRWGLERTAWVLLSGGLFYLGYVITVFVKLSSGG